MLSMWASKCDFTYLSKYIMARFLRTSEKESWLENKLQTNLKSLDSTSPQSNSLCTNVGLVWKGTTHFTAPDWVYILPHELQNLKTVGKIFCGWMKLKSYFWFKWETFFGPATNIHSQRLILILVLKFKDKVKLQVFFFIWWAMWGGWGVLGEGWGWGW